jgi:chromate reductase, NAD(P)H dehydrogenase (quinone)
MSNDPLKVLGIAGSLRQGSYNRMLLRAAVELAPPSIEIMVWDRLREIPPYDADEEERGLPEPVADLKASIERSDALLIASPEYNYGIPGVLKNALDWASLPARRSPMQNKPAAIMGASPGILGTSRGQLQLRHLFMFTESYVVNMPEVLVARAREKFDEDGNLTDEIARRLMGMLLENLEKLVRALRAGGL